MYEYQASVVKIIDGDTLDIQLDVGFYITVQMRLRLLGIDALRAGVRVQLAPEDVARFMSLGGIAGKC